jgi:hypothetical protein
MTNRAESEGKSEFNDEKLGKNKNKLSEFGGDEMVAIARLNLHSGCSFDH